MSKRYGKGSVDRVGNLWVLHLRGTSFERGLQHGTLMRYRVRETINYYRTLPETLTSRFAPGGSLKIKALKKLKRTLVRRLVRNTNSDALEEIRGLAVGLGLSPEDLAEAFVLADVFQAVGALAEKRRKPGPPFIPGMGCTSAIRETATGGLIFGRNFDFWGAGYWDANPAIIFHYPDQGKSFCSIATAGFPTGGITSINEDGLAVAVHQHGSLDSSLQGTPIIDIAHSVVRGASTVEQALEIAGGHKATGGWTLVIAGGSPPRAVALEMSSARQVARPLSDNHLVATNYFLDSELASRELQANVSLTLSNHARYRRAAALIKPSRVSPASLAGLLGDHFDVLAGKERSAGFSISRISTLSSVVFSLPEKKFWVSESTAPSSKGGFVGFDFDAEFGGRRSTVGRLEGGIPPAKRITSAQERYLEAQKEYIYSGDLNRVLMILGECSSLDERESTFPLMEGIIRCRVGNFRGALTSIRHSLELEDVNYKKPVSLLWQARVLDLTDRRDRSQKIYLELSENPDAPPLIVIAAKKGKRRPFNEKNLNTMIMDFTNGDTYQ